MGSLIHSITALLKNALVINIGYPTRDNAHKLLKRICKSEKLNNGRMKSKPLEDMFPYLDRDTFNKEMLINTID